VESIHRHTPCQFHLRHLLVWGTILGVVMHIKRRTRIHRRQCKHLNPFPMLRTRLNTTTQQPNTAHNIHNRTPFTPITLTIKCRHTLQSSKTHTPRLNTVHMEDITPHNLRSATLRVLITLPLKALSVLLISISHILMMLAIAAFLHSSAYCRADWHVATRATKDEIVVLLIIFYIELAKIDDTIVFGLFRTCNK